MLELLLFILLGIILGIIFGLIPGIHPNFLILFAPLLFAFSQDVQNLLVFVVALAVTNSVVDAIPSIMLGAPEPGMELSVSPGHRMLMQGHGYEAVKLTAIGSIGAVIFISLFLPLIVVSFPAMYSLALPFMFFILAVFSVYIIAAQRGRRLLALLAFAAAGLVGIFFARLPVDSSLLLFPVLTGFFGASTLLVQVRQKRNVPRQKGETYVSRRLTTRAVVSGSVGGLFAGVLPGIGTSQIAALATVDKNERSFLVTLGALTTANIIISIVSLWLIGKARSGASVIIQNFTQLAFSDVLLVVAAAVISVSAAVVATLHIARRFLPLLEKVDYNMVSKVILAFLAAMVILFSGVYGLFLFVICTALGIFVTLSGLNRSLLMAVLIVPTLIFYLPF